MTTSVYILLRSRDIKKIKVNDKKDSFRYREGKYILESIAINAVARNKVKTKLVGGKAESVEELTHKGTEIMFFEGNSTPVFIKDDATTRDSSLIYLGHYLAENALRQTGALPSEAMSKLFTNLRSTFTLENIGKLVLALVIGGSIAWGYLIDYGII